MGKGSFRRPCKISEQEFNANWEAVFGSAPKKHHECPVVRVVLEPHPNADTLSLVRVGGYTVVVKTDEWKDRTCGVFVPPESVLPPELGVHAGRPDTSCLVKAHRFRGEWSNGVLIPLDYDARPDTNMAGILGIVPRESLDDVASRISMGSCGEDESGGPVGAFPKYDVENLRSWNRVFEAGEEVIVTEKIHGCNGRYVWCPSSNRMWVGSRTRWKKEAPNSPWWKALYGNPAIEKFCRENPGWTVYCEVYGSVQDLKYGVPAGEFRIAVFDVWDSQSCRYLDWDYVATMGSISGLLVPTLFRGAFLWDTCEKLAGGLTTMPGATHIREGIVIRANPMRPFLGLPGNRAILKLVSNEYLERQ